MNQFHYENSLQFQTENSTCICFYQGRTHIPFTFNYNALKIPLWPTLQPVTNTVT